MQSVDLRFWARKISRKPFEVRDRLLRERGWYDLGERSEMDGVFVGGCGRSGTTLFQVMLGRHSRLFCGPETSLFGLPFNLQNIAPVWNLPLDDLERDAAACTHLVEFAECFYTAQTEKAGKARWVDKTPNNVRVLPKLLTWFPRCKFIHVVRDGRDVACSLRHHPRERVIKGKLRKVHVTNPIAKCAELWLRDTSAGLAFRSHPRCIEIRYEQLVADPETELRRICAFIGEEYEGHMLEADEGIDPLDRGRLMNNPNAVQPISNKSIGRWKKDLSPEERREFNNVAGELLIALGYVKDTDWLTDY